MFKKIDDDEALVVEAGVYKPVELYELNGSLFAKCKGGFVRLKANGSTSHASVKLITLHREGPLFQDRFGRLCVEDGSDRRQLHLSVDDEGIVHMVVDDPAGSRKKLAKE